MLDAVVGSCVSVYTWLKFRPAEDWVEGEEGVDLNDTTLFPLNNKEGCGQKRERKGREGGTYDVVVEFPEPVLCHPKGEDWRSCGSRSVSRPSGKVCLVIGRTVYCVVESMSGQVEYHDKKKEHTEA